MLRAATFVGSALHPFIENIVVERYGKVRRAKLYYLRDRTGKSARIKERRFISKSVKQ